jgi:head-tail adaptor
MVLQENTPIGTGTGQTDSWADVVTFSASLGPISASEKALFGTEAAISTHRSIVGYEEIGDDYITSLQVDENYRIYVANTENELAAETFNIVAVEPFRVFGNKIATVEITLRKVE